MTRLVEIQNILESYGGELSSEASAHISATKNTCNWQRKAWR